MPTKTPTTEPTHSAKAGKCKAAKSKSSKKKEVEEVDIVGYYNYNDAKSIRFLGLRGGYEEVIVESAPHVLMNKSVLSFEKSSGVDFVIVRIGRYMIN
eukprot:scaffold6261_cov118-Skeletonema_dohrnii-CCMP3373.AAC.3